MSVGNNFIFKDYEEAKNFLLKNTFDKTEYSYEEFKSIIDTTTIKIDTIEEFKDKMFNALTFDRDDFRDKIFESLMDNILKVDLNLIRLSMIGQMENITINYKPLKQYFENNDAYAIYEDKVFKKLMILCVNYDLTDPDFLVENFPRKTVMLSDTDSAYPNYTILGPWIDKEIINCDIEQFKVKFPVASNEGLYGLYKFNVLAVLGEAVTETILKLKADTFWNSGIDKYSWKTENSMILLNTSGKKLYAYKSVVNEGVPASAGDISAKGFDKAVYSPYSRANQFKVIDILLDSKSDEEMYGKVLRHIFDTQIEVKELIVSGDLRVYAPVKSRFAEYYENPEQWQSIISRVNEALYDVHAENGERQAYIKLIIPKVSVKLEGNERLTAWLDFVKSKSPDLGLRLENVCRENSLIRETITKSGFKSIGIPLSAGSIPTDLIPLIDIEETVGMNTISRISLWLEVIGIEVTNTHRVGAVEFVEL